MDELRATLCTFSDDDLKEFASFIQRQKKKKERKDLELYQLLIKPKPLSTNQILERLYPGEPNPTAYYALRRRLMRHLTGFILLKRFESDNSAAAPIMGLLSLAHYLFDARLEKLVWQYLLKAEKMAAENEQFDLLNTIYNLQIEQADSEFAPGLDEVIEKRSSNKKAADEEERANIANSIITRKLQEVRRQGRDLQFDALIREVLESCGVSQAVSQRPSLLYKLMSITRSAVLARKDFFSFEPYVINLYEQMKAGKGFAPAHRHYQLGLLYMISHVLYRNRKFEKAKYYLGQMEELMQEASQAQLAHFFPRFTFLLSACSAFQNNLPQAIALLQELLDKHISLLSMRFLVTAHMQLSFYYFATAEYAKAWRMLQSIPHSDSWCEKKMGRDWMLKKKVGEIILQIELGNPDLAAARLESVERDYKDLLSHDAYLNERQFLMLLWQIINQPNLLDDPGYVKVVESSIEFQPMEQEDLPNISFYAWLRSKMMKRNYFDVLREFAAMSVVDEPV